MIPPALTIAIGATGFIAAVFLLVWSLCRIAADADEILSARDRREQHAESVADVVHFPRERRRCHTRNGIRGGDAA